MELLDMAKVEASKEMISGLTLRGVTLEGESTGIVERSCVFDNFQAIVARAKEAWDAGLISKYLIIAFDDDRATALWRPDKWNFEFSGEDAGYYSDQALWERHMADCIADDDPIGRRWLDQGERLFKRLEAEELRERGEG